MKKEDLEILVVGQPYPEIETSQFSPTEMGACAELCRHDFNLIRIQLPNLQPDEFKIMRGDTSHPIKAGLIWRAPLLVLYFDFGGGMRFECPFDVNLIQDGSLTIPTQDTPEERLALHIHVIDPLRNNTLMAMRFITLHKDTTRDLIAAINEQKELKYTKPQFDAALARLVGSKTVKQLMTLANMRKMGE